MATNLSRGLRAALLVTLLLFVVGVGLLALLHYQPSRLVPLAERLLSDSLGRRVQIGSLDQVTIARDLQLRASDLALANAPWSENTDMLVVESLFLSIDLPSLWGEGPLLLRELQVEGLQLELEAPEGEMPNWAIWPGDADTVDTPVEEGTLIPVTLQRAEFTGVELRYRDPDQDVRAQLQSLQLAVRDGDTFTELALRGEVNQMPLSALGTLGPAASLQSGQELQLDFQVALGDLEVGARGSVADLATISGADLALDITAPRSRPLLDLLGLQEVRDGRLRFKGRVSDASPGIAILAEGSMADFDLSVEGELTNPIELDGVDLKASVSGPSMAEAGALLGITGFKDVPYHLSGHVVRRDRLLTIEDGLLRMAQGRLSLSGQLPSFPTIDDWQASIKGHQLDLTVLGAIAGLGELPTMLVDIDGELAPNESGLELVDIRVAGPDMDLVLNGVVGKAPDFSTTSLSLEFTGEDMDAVAPLLGVAQLPREPFEMTGRIAAFDRGWRLTDAHLEGAGFRLDLAGEVDQLVGPRQLTGQARLASPDLPAALTAYGLEAQAPGRVPLLLTGRARMVTGGFEIEELRGQVADVKFEGRGLLSNAENWAGSSLKLATRGDALGHDLAPFSHLTIPDEPYSISFDVNYHAPLISIDHLDASLGRHHLGARLALEEKVGEQDFARGHFTLQGENLRDLFSLLGLEADDIEEDEYRLSSAIEASEAHLKFDGLEFKGGNSDLQGRGELAFGEVPHIDVSLLSRALYLPFLLPGNEAQNTQPEGAGQGSTRQGDNEYAETPTAEELELRVIPETPLPLEWIGAIEGKLRYRIDKIILRDGVSASIDAEVAIEDGVLSAKELRWDGVVSQGSAALLVDTRGPDALFQFATVSSRVPLLWLLAEEGAPRQNALYRARLSGSGNNIRELATSLNGALIFKGSGARFSNKGLGLYLGDLVGNILDRLNPATKTDVYTEVECDAGALNFRDGIIEITPAMVLRTDEVDVLAGGSVDLHSESLNISFNTRSRKGIGISVSKAITPYLKLAGTLGHPHITLDPEAVAVSGTAAIATLGLSVFIEGLWDRWITTASSPCEELYAQIEEDTEHGYSELVGISSAAQMIH